MTIRRFIDLVETYTANNSYLLRYLKGGEDGDTRDPYQVWHGICEWLERHDYLEELSELASKKLGREVEFASAADLYEEEPDLFFLLPKPVQQDAYEWAVNYEMQHNPAEAPTTAHLSLNQNRLIDRETWLVHFTDHPYDIAQHGFTYGIDRMDTLGLTTYFTDAAKKHGGYNFAFEADSRYARYGAGEKYGRDAVMFQNSGVHTTHWGDEEDQVIFWGKDVDPRGIVVLTHSDGEWNVMTRHPKAKRDIAFRADSYEKAAKWVMDNFARYRKLLTGF